MLEELRLTSLGVIDEAVLELGPGFTAITGETGAGKTMLVTALTLLLGGRADAGLVRAGAGRARIEGRVDLSTDLASSAALHDLDADLGLELDDGSLILSRTVSAEGRSRAVLGGASVPVGRLGQVADTLMAVHGQSDQHRLRQPARQRQALDRYAGAPVLGALHRYHAAYVKLRDTERELTEVTGSVRERAREAEMLRLGLVELEQVAPEPGEDATLQAEEDRLAHADALRTAAQQAQLLLAGDDEGLPGDALSQLGATRRLLDGVRDHDPAAAVLADRVAELAYLAADVSHDVTGYATSLDADPGRLAWVQQRRAELANLQRRYGDTLDEVLDWGKRAATRLVELDGTDDRVLALEQSVAGLRDELGMLAAAMSRARTDAAHRLAAEVTNELTALAMPYARFEVSVRQRPDPTGLAVGAGNREVAFGPHGVDEVELLLTANVGAPPRPLDKGASGGELSRVMLALEVVLAGCSPVPTLVFDEVDAGVAGTAAIEVGRRLARLANEAQVLVVTHLPQVAAFADRHFAVVKSTEGSVTTSDLHDLSGEDRVAELSRMLAGLAESQAARTHAVELLALATSDR